MVDSSGVARLGGLGSAFSLSLPASWSDIVAGQMFCGIAPELINPHAFGLVRARNTKATDVFAFGMLAWEVSRTLLCRPISRCSPIGVVPRSLPGNRHTPVRWRLPWSIRCSKTTGRRGRCIVKSRIACGV